MHYSRSKIRLFNKKQIRQISLWLVAVVTFEFLFFPWPTLAADQVEQPDLATEILIFNLDDNSIESRDLVADRWSLRLPQKEVVIKEIPRPEERSQSRTVVLTAYNSDRAQCDDSPCITANGFNVCQHGIEDTVAANFLPFGTRIKIPTLFGDRVFIVRDRMARRHHNRVDIWMKSYSAAIQFGIRTATIEILPDEVIL